MEGVSVYPLHVWDLLQLFLKEELNGVIVVIELLLQMLEILRTFARQILEVIWS
jgi:hypothetical protein